MYFDIEDSEGNVFNWACEVGPNIPWMIREGWTRQRSEAALIPGTPVTVTISPARSGRPVGIANKIVDEHGDMILLEFGTSRSVFRIVERGD